MLCAERKRLGSKVSIRSKVAGPQQAGHLFEQSTLMKTSLKIFGALVLLVTVTGCQQEDSSPEYPTVKFEGKPDSRMVGTWTNDTKKSTYTIKDDGSYHLEATVTAMGNTMYTKDDGHWAVNDDKLLFKDGQGNVAQYKFELDGTNLTLDLNGKGYNKSKLHKVDPSEAPVQAPPADKKEPAKKS